MFFKSTVGTVPEFLIKIYSKIRKLTKFVSSSTEGDVPGRENILTGTKVAEPLLFVVGYGSGCSGTGKCAK